ncbi:D-inositol 3-phosphate glycosyltransferase [Enhygromyxa salina]|uniref:D-inositol 3-phosphate glycosyltransferase n=1 Tax=Enhygromyxa salina TaxID=215803 RepID=A0A2S9YAG4_9BACT|nr:glycosyltransferase family 4 protein [Enhygromyxa salina]PRQ02093.1 D-inositol 3-phosphate glycosyltransferase [Enhygromyxa salina]
MADAELRVGTWGFGPHPWVSVERTRGFYARSCAPDIALVDLDAGPLAEDVDAILSFASARWHREPRPGDTPIVLAMHGGPVVEHALLRELLPKLRTSDTLLVNCRSDRAIVEGLCEQPPHVQVLPLPVDTDCFVPFERAPCRAEFGLDPDAVVLGFVARLVPQKNLHGFLRVVAELRRRLAPRPVQALVIGNFSASYPVLDYGCRAYPDYIQELRRRLELGDALRYFAARLSDDQLAAAYSAMDFLVHPSMAIDENFGYAPIEAMACGTPVVASAYGGIKDSVIHGETGVLLSTWASEGGIRMNLSAAVEAIVALVDEPARHEALSVAAFDHVHANYAEARCAGVLRATLEQAARRRGGEALRTRPSSVRVADDSLPPTDPPYAAFAEAIGHYVSHPRPRLRPASLVRRAAPTRRDDAGELRLDDPAWPAAVRLDPEDLELLERCARPVAASELAPPGTAAWTRLQRYLDRGLLIPAEYEQP